jgi:hypothetical protein
VITDLIIEGIGSFARFVLQLFPSISLPTFFDSGTAPGTVGGDLNGWFGNVSAFGNWLPLEAVGPALLIVITALGVMVTIKLIRILASFATGGGGSS